MIRPPNRIEERILALLILAALISVVISGLRSDPIFGKEWSEGILGNLGTELLGAVLTFIAFELVVGARREEEESAKREAEEKARLIRDMGSSINDVAINAVEELRAKGWLYNLQEISLSDANLQTANLLQAQLPKSNLFQANLQRANLLAVNLERASLNFAKLQNVIADGINLSKATLRRANLENGRFLKANLIGTNLVESNLKWARFFDSLFDETTILPDGTYWTPETDMGRFTDPTHADFWQPEWVKNQQE